MVKLVQSFILLIFIASWGAAGATRVGDRQVWRTDEATLVYDARIQSIADDVHRHYPDVTRELERAFGWSLKVPPTIVLISEAGDFRQIVSNPLFVAVAIPSRNTIVMDISRLQSAPFSLKITLAHELAHLLLHQHIDRARLPRWLDEGVCQWFTGGVAEILLDRYRPMLGKALGAGEFIDFSDLTHRFPAEQRGLMLAYEQSLDFVTFIASRHGTENLTGILKRLKAGERIENSIEAQLGIGLEDLETLWQEKMTGGVVWWGRLASHLDALLFFAAAVLTVAGFLIRRRGRNHSRADDEADQDAD